MSASFYRSNPNWQVIDYPGTLMADIWRLAAGHAFSRRAIEVADAFLDGGDRRRGFARIGCENPECRHETLLAFSCHR